MPRDERHRLRAVGLAQRAEEEVLALERADDGPAQRALERRGHADEQRVRQDDEVEGRQAVEVAEELAELLGLEALLALEGRDGERPELVGVHREAAPGGRLDDRGRVPEAVEDGRGLAEERHVLLEVDADPPEEDVPVADVRLVGEGGRVDGEEQHVVLAGEELRGERVVAQAAAAVHPARARGDLEEAHAQFPPGIGGWTAATAPFSIGRR